MEMQNTHTIRSHAAIGKFEFSNVPFCNLLRIILGRSLSSPTFILYKREIEGGSAKRGSQLGALRLYNARTIRSGHSFRSESTYFGEHLEKAKHNAKKSR